MKSEYDVYNTKTGTVVSVHKSAVAAHRKADKLDLEYGAILYGVRLNNSHPALDPYVGSLEEEEELDNESFLDGSR